MLDTARQIVDVLPAARYTEALPRRFRPTWLPEESGSMAAGFVVRSLLSCGTAEAVMTVQG
jgi:hypothetical protein